MCLGNFHSQRVHRECVVRALLPYQAEQETGGKKVNSERRASVVRAKVTQRNMSKEGYIPVWEVFRLAQRQKDLSNQQSGGMQLQDFGQGNCIPAFSGHKQVGFFSFPKWGSSALGRLFLTREPLLLLSQGCLSVRRPWTLLQHVQSP